MGAFFAPQKIQAFRVVRPVRDGRQGHLWRLQSDNVAMAIGEKLPIPRVANCVNPYLTACANPAYYANYIRYVLQFRSTFP
jgi:hypothetical protein